MRNFHKHGIDTRGRISGKVKTICPQCNDTRGHKGNRSLSIDLDPLYEVLTGGNTLS